MFSDTEGIFNVTPVIAKIPASQTALFEVVFSPNRRSNLFAKELIGYVFSEEQQTDDSTKEILAFPTIVSARLTGTRVLSYFRGNARSSKSRSCKNDVFFFFYRPLSSHLFRRLASSIRDTSHRKNATLRAVIPGLHHIRDKEIRTSAIDVSLYTADAESLRRETYDGDNPSVLSLGTALRI